MWNPAKSGRTLRCSLGEGEVLFPRRAEARITAIAATEEALAATKRVLDRRDGASRLAEADRVVEALAPEIGTRVAWAIAWESVAVAVSIPLYDRRGS